jgi:hypothetical protein
MQRSVYQFIAITVLALAASACEDLGVGDPCIPERIPCSKDKGCGYDQTESYIESSSVQCRSRLCIVHKLDNGNNTVGDPTVLCDDDPDNANCVHPENLDESVYCTCRCDGPKTSVQFCECPHGFECTEILKLGGDGIKGSYCVRPKEE